MVIYFTGTGNSRYLAKLLSEQTEDCIVDATELIRQDEHPEFNSEAPYVFVSPTYAWRLPRLFEQWIKKCTFRGCKKAYFVLSCGSEIGAAGKYAKKLAANVGFEYMGTAEVLMPENYIVMFSAPPVEQDHEILARAEEQICELVDLIKGELGLPPVKISFSGRLYSGIVNSLFYGFSLSAKGFAVTDRCVSCGKCAEHCMLSNITIKDGKPVWGDNCTHCMACICRCPAEAIEFGSHTKGLRRYVCTKE